MAEVTLTASMRTNLTTLQQTADIMAQTQDRLATGKRVVSALDNPTSFFAASAHMQRANDLAARKDGMSEAIQSIKAASTGITGVKTLLESAKGVAETARTTAASGLSALNKQFNEIMSQVRQMVADSGYKGTNFLGGTAASLDVLFNETGTNKLTVNGFNGKASGLIGTSVGNSAGALAGSYTNLDVALGTAGISSFVAGTAAGSAGTVSSFSGVGFINSIQNGLNAAIAQLQVQSAKLSSNLAIVNARMDFTNSLINIEKTGSDKLTLADTNEEGANMLMLQTRNQLGTTALSLASQAAQGVLRLF